MEPEYEIHDEIFHCMLLGDTRNNERPLNAAELLNMAALAIEDLYAKKRTADGIQPFMVRHIAVDLYGGIVKIYYNDNLPMISEKAGE